MAKSLSGRQYRAVLDLVGEAHDTQDLNELRHMLLPGLRRVVPSEHSSYNEVLRDGTPAVVISDPDLPPAAYEAWERHAGSNPLVERYFRTRDGRAYRFSDVVSEEEFHRTPIYLELYRPLGIKHQIAFILPSSPDLVIGLVLNRIGGRDFSDDEQSMLNLLRPHLIQAYRNAQLRERASGVVDAMRSGLDARGTAALVVDASGALVIASERGGEIAEEIAAADLVEGEQLPEPLAGALRAPAQMGTIRHPEGDSVLVQRVRAPEGTTLLFLDRAARVLTPAALEALGLTPREAAVLAELARGGTTAEVAAELGTSPRTVAKHAQSIHRKLGVRDRAQAVATAWAATAAADW